MSRRSRRNRFETGRPIRTPEKRNPVAPPVTEQPSENLISRRNFLISGAVLAVLGGAGYCSYKRNSQQPPERNYTVKPIKPVHQFNHEQKEILSEDEFVMGNVKFIISNPEMHSFEDKKDLFRKMQSAYQKLVNYLGEEAMTLPERIDFPVYYDNKMPNKKNGVTWDIKIRGFYADGNPVFRTNPTPDVIKINGDEKILAHEFVHLFAQGTGGTETKAFREGHARMIENQLYGYDKNDEDIRELLSNPKVDGILETGMDYTEIDVFVFKGGGGYDDLVAPVYLKWAKDWGKLVEKDPLFMRKFYSRIAQLKRSGIMVFTKAIYISIAKEVCPQFEEWYKNTKSVKEIGEVDSETVQKALKISKNRILIASFTPKKRGSVNGRLIPPILSMPITGMGKIIYIDNTGKEKIYSLEREHFLFEIIEIPEYVYNSKKIKVMIGDIEIPCS